MCRLHPELYVKEDDVMHLALSQGNLDEGSSPSFRAGRKLGDVAQALLWTLLHEDPQCPSRVLLNKVAERQLPIVVSIRHVNRWRAKWQLNGRKGRPRQALGHWPVASGAEIVQIMPRLSFVGVHLFAHWLDQHEAFGPVVAQLTQAVEAHKQTHPGDDFALLHHREPTLRHRFAALFFAPLFGIDTLSGFDTREHPLPTLLGRSYQSSTLSQFLGQLEHVDAAEALMPTLVPDKAGQIAYVDGHMIAYWSRVAMHKGKITMLGRIMAGSQAVITHSEAGYALFVAYHPPDLHLSHVVVDYCHKVAMSTGTVLFVIDRAVNSVAMACAFDAQGLGLLCMLDDNEHQGLESFEATLVDTLDDGTKVYSGSWKATRPDDPRHFVLVVPTEGKPLAYWGTPKVKDALQATEWPRVYRERNEIQEHSFKRMIDHGALKTNYGRKKIVGPDRHQQRAKEQLDRLRQAAKRRLDKKAEALKTQQDKVAESASKGHGKRLEQRQRALSGLEKALQESQHKHNSLAEQLSALDPPRQRADRDFRKQAIMTFRTLLLENMLMSFMAVLLGHLSVKVSLECLLKILFERSGARMETTSQVIYWINTTGLSISYQRLLKAVVDGLCAMDLRYEGKPIRVCLKGFPP
jgi:hypothetical protein